MFRITAIYRDLDGTLHENVRELDDETQAKRLYEILSATPAHVVKLSRRMPATWKTEKRHTKPDQAVA